MNIFPDTLGLVFGLKVPFGRRVSMISNAFPARFSDLAAVIPLAESVTPRNVIDSSYFA